MKKFLEVPNFAVRFANDGLEAVNITRESGKFDIIFMDCQVIRRKT